MVVMHILNTGSYSGAENVVITIINSLKEMTDSVYVSFEGPIQEVLSHNHIRFEPITSMSISEIRRVIQIVKPDIIHAHDYTAGIVSSMSTSIPIINHIHNNSPWIRRLSVKTVAYAISCIRYRQILSVSNSIVDEFYFGHLIRRKTIVIGNPIDISVVRSLAGKSEKKYDIAYLGRLSKAKNPIRFLEIVEKTKKQNGDIKAIIIGDGELRTEVEKRINDKNLQKNIVLVGFQDNPYKYLVQAKTMCMPSDWEGFGLAAVEALALGIPVVASSVGGLKDFISFECGALCSTNEEFCSEIMKLLNNREYYLDKKLGSCRVAERMNNLNSYSARIQTVYQSLMGE